MSLRLGNAADVYLASAELAAGTLMLGRLPMVEEYFQAMALVDQTAADIYRYLKERGDNHIWLVILVQIHIKFQFIQQCQVMIKSHFP